jgi:hypothetical protein
MVDQGMILKSEFACVRVEPDHSGNGPRLMIRDERSQKTIYLDPLELESLAWCRHRDLTRLLDPARRDGSGTEADQLAEVLRALEHDA